MRILVLGAAAGGGFPQWNGNDAAARSARAGHLRHRTQSSVAVSADGVRWVIFNASPDLRQQISANPQLHPAAEAPVRSSPIAAVVLTNADVDHVAGLLSLRERQPLALYAHSRVLDVLSRNSVFDVLDSAFVTRRALKAGETTPLAAQDGAPLGLEVHAFCVPGKVALWLEDRSAPDFGTVEGDTLGLEIRDGKGRSFFYIPACAGMTADLADRLRGAALVFFDGTLWRDDEMILAGAGPKSGRRMGHMSCEETIAAFRDLRVSDRIFIHLNNTNPLFRDDAPERRLAAEAGWRIAEDGMEIAL